MLAPFWAQSAEPELFLQTERGKKKKPPRIADAGAFSRVRNWGQRSLDEWITPQLVVRSCRAIRRARAARF